MSRPRLRGWALSASAPEPLGGARLLIDTWRTAGAATQVVAAAPPPLVDDPSVLGDGPSAAFVACRCRSGSAPLLRAGPGSRVGLRGTERPSAARPTPMRDPSRGAGRPQRWRTRRLRGPVRGVETATAGSPWAAGAAAPLGADARTHENAKDYPAPARGLRGGARDRAGLRLRPPGGPRGIARGSGCGGGHAPGNHPSWGGGAGSAGDALAAQARSCGHATQAAPPGRGARNRGALGRRCSPLAPGAGLGVACSRTDAAPLRRERGRTVSSQGWRRRLRRGARTCRWSLSGRRCGTRWTPIRLGAAAHSGGDIVPKGLNVLL